MCFRTYLMEHYPFVSSFYVQFRFTCKGCLKTEPFIFVNNSILQLQFHYFDAFCAFFYIYFPKHSSCTESIPVRNTHHRLCATLFSFVLMKRFMLKNSSVFHRQIRLLVGKLLNCRYGFITA